MITLTTAQTQIHVPPDKVYFAFASGRLQFDCVSCKAQCCRGHGYQVNFGPELDTQLRRSPAVRFFLSPCEGAQHLHVTNCAPHCFFLNEEHRCRIQMDHGHDAKPTTCRLFPFNDFRLAGSYLIVLPHASLCPLEIVEGSNRSRHSAHDELLREMGLKSIDTHIGGIRDEPRDVAAVIATEIETRAEADHLMECGDYRTFAAAQFARSSRRRDTADSSSLRVAQFLDVLSRVLGAGCDHPALESLVSRMLIALTPTLRAHILFRSQAEPAPALPVHADSIPKLLLAFHQFVSLACQAGGQQVTYLAVMKLFRELETFLRMLALLDDVLVWRPDARIDVSWNEGSGSQASYLRIAKCLLPDSQLRSPKTLATAILENVHDQGVARILFLKRLAGRLAGKVVLSEQNASLRDRFRHPRSAVQQWALGWASADQLAAASRQRTS